MKIIKLNGIGDFGNTFDLAIDCFDIKYMMTLNEITVIKLSDNEFTVTESIDEIIELIATPSDALMKVIKSLSENEQDIKPFDINLN